MTHSHDRLTLEEIELPTRKGGQVSFWSGDSQYTLYALQTNNWDLLGPARFGKMPRLGNFSATGDGYAIDDDREGRVPAGDDWRVIVRRFM
jgi:hypothetical protein